MKTKEELEQIKEEVGTQKKKLAELNEEDLEQIRGGYLIVDGHILEFGVPSSRYCPKCGNQMMCIYDCTTGKEVDFTCEVCW